MSMGEEPPYLMGPTINCIKDYDCATVTNDGFCGSSKWSNTNWDADTWL